MDHNAEPLYIRPKDVARMYGLSRHTVYQAIKRGDLPARKIANPDVVLIRPDDAREWMESKFVEEEK